MQISEWYHIKPNLAKKFKPFVVQSGSSSVSVLFWQAAALALASNPSYGLAFHEFQMSSWVVPFSACNQIYMMATETSSSLRPSATVRQQDYKDNCEKGAFAATGLFSSFEAVRSLQAVHKCNLVYNSWLFFLANKAENKMKYEAKIWIYMESGFVQWRRNFFELEEKNFKAYWKM